MDKAGDRSGDRGVGRVGVVGGQGRVGRGCWWRGEVGLEVGWW